MIFSDVLRSVGRRAAGSRGAVSKATVMGSVLLWRASGRPLICTHLPVLLRAFTDLSNRLQRSGEPPVEGRAEDTVRAALTSIRAHYGAFAEQVGLPGDTVVADRGAPGL